MLKVKKMNLVVSKNVEMVGSKYTRELLDTNNIQVFFFKYFYSIKLIIKYLA